MTAEQSNEKKPGRPAVPLAHRTLHLVQITDCHIFESEQGILQELNTRRSFEAVKKAVFESGDNTDLLLATGDLSQDGSAASYRYLAQQFDEFELPVFWLPGNHDAVGVMLKNFTGINIDASKHIVAGAWQIVMLDSTIPGEVHGCVAPSQLDFLETSLRQHPDKHALVCLHHQALDTGSDWLDNKGLDAADRLLDRIGQHGNIRAVLWGHVHQDFHRRINSVEWMSTPSTCVQFKPRSKTFAIGDEAPGYRHLRLNSDGSIETRVHRIDYLDLALDRSP